MIKLPWELPSDTMETERERERWRETAAEDQCEQLCHDLQQIHSSSFWRNTPHSTCYNKINVLPYSRPKTVIYAQAREKSRAPVSSRIQTQTKEPKTAIWHECRQRTQHLHIHKSQWNVCGMKSQTPHHSLRRIRHYHSVTFSVQFQSNFNLSNNYKLARICDFSLC